MHTVHHSQAVIIKSAPSGESNRLVWLFTKEFGLIVATVQGVRNKGAKLQSQVVDYAFIEADLVKGKDIWRLVSASVALNPLLGSLRNPAARAYVRTLSFISRFVIDEEPHESLYKHLLECAELISAPIDAKSLDTLSIWKMLALLGYIAPTEEESVFMDTSLKEAIDKLSETNRAELILKVQDAIKQSHL